MSHILIITGGRVNIDFTKEYIKTLSYDKVFAVDKGLEYVDELGLMPDLIIGDFDTVDNDILNRYMKYADEGQTAFEIIRHPARKNATDTELAVTYAKDCGAKSITIFGATGTRMDHVLSNLGLLIYVAREHMECVIIDECNRIRLMSSEYGTNDCIIERDAQFGKYLSLIPLSEYLTDLTMEGVEYPLDSARVERLSSLTISNEINEKTARIHIGDGTAFLIESRD